MRPRQETVRCADMYASSRLSREPWISYIRWYTGSGMDTELLCDASTSGRTVGRPQQTSFARSASNTPQLRLAILRVFEVNRKSVFVPSLFDLQLRNTPLPKEVGKIVDFSPVNQESRSIWLLLVENGVIVRFQI